MFFHPKQLAPIYVSQLAMEFYNVLSSHLRQMTVTSSGAFVLQMDTLAYHKSIVEWNIRVDPAEMAKFEVLKEVPNLLCLPSDNIPSLLSSSPGLSAMGKTELLGWLKMRPDFSRSRIQSILGQGYANAVAATVTAAMSEKPMA